ncbi:unnamed protein product [Blepharisma stoltei]|uniref:Peroxisomal membrane protein 4 n=1 Tax=Blepharisma stoltei TaxID=1481888 RepID=A0AAU9J4X4_9CILI|nr:unnamed protein product [Blepharisma stoltei]
MEIVSTCPHTSCVLSSLKGLSNGLSYGAKVRFTHSLVIALLFGRQPWIKRVQQIISNTIEHSTRLGLYVFLYKTILCIVTRIRKVRTPINSAIAGAIAGYCMFSKETNVNVQIILYLFSRVLTSGVGLLYKKGLIPKSLFLENTNFAILTTICWSIVMYLFEERKESLQTSLVHSMTFLYKDSEVWKDWYDALPFPDFFRNLLTKHK